MIVVLLNQFMEHTCIYTLIHSVFEMLIIYGLHLTLKKLKVVISICIPT